MQKDFKIIIKNTEIDDQEKIEILFKVFDILLFSNNNKEQKNND